VIDGTLDRRRVVGATIAARNETADVVVGRVRTAAEQDDENRREQHAERRTRLGGAACRDKVSAQFCRSNSHIFADHRFFLHRPSLHHRTITSTLDTRSRVNPHELR